MSSATLLSFGKCIYLASLAQSTQGLWSQIRILGSGFGYSRLLVLDAKGLENNDPCAIVVNDFDRAVGMSASIADWADSDVLDRCRSDRRPFLLSELDCDDRFAEQRWRRGFPLPPGNGLFVPVHDDRNLQAVFLFHGLGIRSDAGSVTLLRALAVAAHARFEELVNSAQEGPVSLASQREAQCLHWLSEGFDDNEIAGFLGISKRTVRFHIDNLKRKVGASRRTQILAMTFRGKRNR